MMPQISEGWVSVLEDTPPIARGYRNVSRNVVVLTEGGAALEAYYDYHRDVWRDSNSRIIKLKCIAWRDKE
jgi:hypothetical protein